MGRGRYTPSLGKHWIFGFAPITVAFAPYKLLVLTDQGQLANGNKHIFVFFPPMGPRHSGETKNKELPAREKLRFARGKRMVCN